MGPQTPPADLSPVLDSVLLVTRGGPFFIHPERDAAHGIRLEARQESDCRDFRDPGLRSFDLFVLPAGLLVSLGPDERPWPTIAYGEGMEAAVAFEAGALDFLRIRWPASELYARIERLRRPRFRWRGAEAILFGEALEILEPGSPAPRRLALGGEEARILRLLAAARGGEVPRRALQGRGSAKALSMRISRLRRTLENFAPGLGEAIVARRGVYLFLP